MTPTKRGSAGSTDALMVRNVWTGKHSIKHRGCMTAGDRINDSAPGTVGLRNVEQCAECGNPIASQHENAHRATRAGT